MLLHFDYLELIMHNIICLWITEARALLCNSVNNLTVENPSARPLTSNGYYQQAMAPHQGPVKGGKSGF